MIVKRTDSQYDLLYRQWQREGGTQFMYQAAMWRAVEDNGEMKFVRVSEAGAFHYYGDDSSHNIAGPR